MEPPLVKARAGQLLMARAGRVILSLASRAAVWGAQRHLALVAAAVARLLLGNKLITQVVTVLAG
jgi:hypothetical protein